MSIRNDELHHQTPDIEAGEAEYIEEQEVLKGLAEEGEEGENLSN